MMTGHRERPDRRGRCGGGLPARLARAIRGVPPRMPTATCGACGRRAGWRHTLSRRTTDVACELAAVVRPLSGAAHHRSRRDARGWSSRGLGRRRTSGRSSRGRRRRGVLSSRCVEAMGFSHQAYKKAPESLYCPDSSTRCVPLCPDCGWVTTSSSLGRLTTRFDALIWPLSRERWPSASSPRHHRRNCTSPPRRGGSFCRSSPCRYSAVRGANSKVSLRPPDDLAPRAAPQRVLTLAPAQPSPGGERKRRYLGSGHVRRNVLPCSTSMVRRPHRSITRPSAWRRPDAITGSGVGVSSWSRLEGSLPPGRKSVPPNWIQGARCDWLTLRGHWRASSGRTTY